MKKTKGGVMKKKTVSPYEQLRLRAKEWATAVLYPHSVGMVFYKKRDGACVSPAGCGW